MGNITPRPTKRLEMLNEEMNDFSANIASSVNMEASQNVIVNQEQNIVIKNSTFEGCDFKASQEADVVAKQIATFKVFLSNPKQVLKKLTQGPNSLFGQAFNSTSPVMNGFLQNAQQAFGSAYAVELRQKMTNIMKININQKAIMKATQNVMVNQTQNVFMEGLKCVNSKINITQKAVVNVVQNVMMQVVMNAMASNPQFRQAVRAFNGDYDKNLMDESIDEGTQLPEACMEDLKPSSRAEECGECEDCPLCPIPKKCEIDCPDCKEYVLNAQLLYSFAGIFLFLILFIMILK